MNTTDSGWECEDCGWPWPRAGKPPEYAECDNCGGELAQPYTPADPAALVPADPKENDR
jgi:hypothetical protein